MKEENNLEDFTEEELDIIDRYFGLEKWHFAKKYPDTKIILEQLFESEHCPFCGCHFKGSVMLCEECERVFCDRCDDERNAEILEGKFCPDCIEEKEKRGEINKIKS